MKTRFMGSATLGPGPASLGAGAAPVAPSGLAAAGLAPLVAAAAAATERRVAAAACLRPITAAAAIKRALGAREAARGARETALNDIACCIGDRSAKGGMNLYRIIATTESLARLWQLKDD